MVNVWGKVRGLKYEKNTFILLNIDPPQVFRVKCDAETSYLEHHCRFSLQILVGCFLFFSEMKK